jgi:transcriptional accessory protein Tex/SPT6
LDATIVHPDDYSTANAILRKYTQFQHLYSHNIPLPKDSNVSDRLELYILGLLSRADPRQQQRIIAPLPIKKAGEFSCTLSADQQTLVGAVVRGVVRNITTFGAFINISDCGFTQDGLLHISNYPVGVKDPHHYSINEEVDVKIMSIKASVRAVEDRMHQAGDKLRIILSAQL